MGKDGWQQAERSEVRSQRSEIRRQRTGSKVERRGETNHQLPGTHNPILAF